MNDAAIHFGMGRVGSGAYDFLLEHHGDLIIGCDSEPVTVKRNYEAGVGLAEAAYEKLQIQKQGNI